MGQTVLPSASAILRLHSLLWMRDYVRDEAGVAVDLEIRIAKPY